MGSQPTYCKRKAPQKSLLGRILPLAVLGIFLVMLALCAGRILSVCVSYEGHHAYTADAPLYWAVGRGILNGVKPYSGLYENKPVGVFLISALSLGLTGGTVLCNVFSLLCTLVIGLLPAVATLELCIQKKLPAALVLLYTGFAWIPGMFLMLYVEMRSGGFQVEGMGAAFICLYEWALLHIRRGKGVRLLIWTALAALFAMGGVMMKEPFALVAVAGSLLLVDSLWDFLWRTVLPMCIGGVMGLALLLLCGVLPAYFQIYLANMFGNHLSVYGSPFARMLSFDRLATDLSSFSRVFLGLILLSFLLILLSRTVFARGVSPWRRLWRGLTVGLALLSASFCVGLGGQYYNHHFIFAAPLYFLAFLLVCRMLVEAPTPEKKQHGPAATAVVGLLLLICLLPRAYAASAWNRDYTDKYKDIVSQAAYVDALLDFYGEDTYQFLGFNGESMFYGLTTHSPLGPAFVQDRYNFTDGDSWFSQQLLNQLDKANIVILDRLNMPAINDQVREILDTQFSTTPATPFTAVEKPASFQYQIYYRIS